MWKQKIGMSIGSNYALATPEVIRMLRRIGFDAISPQWGADIDLHEIASTAAQCGMIIQSLHAPFQNAANMWSDDKALSADAREDLISAVKACARFQIPVLVVHTWIGFAYTFDAERLYFQNFDEVIEFAGAQGVKIAFENTEGEEYLFALMEHFKDNPLVGFCWDSGHELCYNHSQDLLAKYGDRLIMTHINDNLGISRFDGKTYWTDDLHLLPYDGIADWEYNIERLKKSKKQDVINFELNITSKPDRHENDIYGDMPLERYFTEAYKRACKIAYRYVK